LNGLTDREYLAEIDWAMPASDFFYGIDSTSTLTCLSDRFRWRIITADGRAALLPDEPDRWAQVMADGWTDSLPEEFLPGFGKWCEARGVVLAQFELDSDSYPLILIEVGLFSTIQDLTAQTGYGLLHRWPRSLA
jgi:hypothetical protein